MAQRGPSDARGERNMVDPSILERSKNRSWASLLSAAFPCFGLWTMHTWIFWLNTNKPFPIEGGNSWFSLYLAQSLFLVGMAVAFRSAEKPSRTRLQAADMAFAVIGCATTALYAAGSGFIALPTTIGAGAVALGGICLGWGYLRWGVFYSGLALKNALGCIFTACILGAFAKSVITAAPASAGFAFALCLPILSALFLRMSFKRQQPIPSTDIRYTPETFGSLWKVLSCVAVYAFIYALIGGLPKMHDSTLPHAALLGHFIEAAVSTFILWWVVAKHRSVSFAQLWRCIMLLIGAMLVLAAFEPTAGLQTMCSTSISYLVVVFLWLLLSDIAHHSSMHPYIVFGMGWLAYTFPNYLGRLLGESGLVASNMTPTLALVLLFAIMLAITLLLDSRDPTMQRIFSDLDESAPAPRDFAFIDERCAAIGRQHELTAREIEVMQLLCKGRSKAYIAETLFITENTVRGHARRLYAKLDVHSKKELQELIGI